ncbi:MAG: hypothetical protein F6J93_24925 [Oscillatoria sp. SIO1A7]|nr:hypothetical protein [Oscillatoria sp. SIO1A7]
MGHGAWGMGGQGAGEQGAGEQGTEERRSGGGKTLPLCPLCPLCLCLYLFQCPMRYAPCPIPLIYNKLLDWKDWSLRNYGSSGRIVSGRDAGF